MVNNSFVKFYRLNNAAYTAKNYTPDPNGIYFITDTKELIVNGVNYGMSTSIMDKLDNAIDTVEFTSPNTIRFVSIDKTTDITVTLPNAGKNTEGVYTAGLMSADDKKILDTLNGGVDVTGSVEKQVADALASAKSYTDTEIEKLDVTDNAVVGSYVSAVSETDGKIAVTRAELPTVAEIKSEGQAIIAVKEDKGVISATAGDIAAAHVTIADTAGHFTAGTVEAALEELYSQSGAGSKVTLESAEGTEDNVLKVYTIKQGGSEVGKINIPKDLVVSSGSVVKGTWDGNTFTEGAGSGTALKLVIANQTNPVYINTLDLVKDHTAGNGIAISDTNVISVVVDPTSETGLSVGAAGIKLTGIKAATTEVNVKNDGHVKVAKTTGSNGQAVYTVSENDIASATLLGTATDSKDANTAFGKIAAEADARTKAIEALDADVNSTGGTHVSINVVETDGKVATVTVTESDIASAALLGTVDDTSAKNTAFGKIAAEVAAREAQDNKIEASVGLAADGSHRTTNGHYTSEATTIAGEISALDTQVFTNTGAISALKDNTVNGKKISTNPTLGGADIKLTGYSPDANGDLFEADNTVNAAMKIIMQQLVWHEA